MNKIIEDFAKSVLDGGIINKDQATELCKAGLQDGNDLLYWANRIRTQFFANKVKICSIIPGRVGGCDQDCAFCAQSAKYKTHIEKTTILSDEEILGAAKQAKENGVPHIGIVYSGRSVSEKEFARVERLAGEINTKYGIKACAGLGILDKEHMVRLARAGVARYNHNLETSRDHYGKIVSTHVYDDRVNTVLAAKEAGLGLCTGGIFGIGENWSDRIDMAIELRGLEVDMAPLNFLHPIPGTPMGDNRPLAPREILAIIAMYRFILPKTHLKVAGGRIVNLRDLQSWVFYAGATSIMSGNYLTTAGRAVSEDLQMLADLGLEPENG
ncbi:MAG: biotin synthase BioB [Planctomycetes bacterium GWF2_50_10]|nr:MAG: biotin synthase BioB [Planctomycetes bacterium GWF2_50_10]